MRVLLLSFYYSPDLSAGSFRATSLVEALKRKLPKNSDIQVLTTLPNRYGSFLVDASKIEFTPGLQVHRLSLPSHQSGMLDQSKAFLSYWRQVMQHVEHGNYDIVIGTSSRLMTAVLAARVAQKKNAVLYLDIRDIFVDTIKDVLPRSFTAVLKPILNFLESWTIQRADRVNLVSKGFAEYFKKKYPRQHYSFFPNGIDIEFTEASVKSHCPEARINSLLTILYAGNLGAGQGLEVILPKLAKKLQGIAVIRIIGDGGRKAALCSELAIHGIHNVVLVNPMRRDMLIAEYKSADILFMHLSDHEAFKKVLPSKIFEYAATGKPIWAGVAGYAAKLWDPLESTCRHASLSIL